MFLGTSRVRWILAGLLIVGGMALFLLHPWGKLSGGVGIVILLIGLATFLYTPTKKSSVVPSKAEQAAAAAQAARAAQVPARPALPAPPPRPKGPRPEFEARDRDAV